MLDFEGSVAQQNVTVTTDTVTTSVVGDNFYKLLYVTQAALSNALSVNKDTYEAVIDAVDATVLSDAQKTFMKANFASFYEYGADTAAFIISASMYKKYKYRAYATYVETEYAKVDDGTEITWAPTALTLSTLDEIALDEEFTKLFTDIPVPKLLANTEDITELSQIVDPIITALNAATKIAVFARGVADDGLAWDDCPSPALYQMGRTLSYVNITGTPVGNSWDMVALDNADVLPTRSTSVTEMSQCNAVVTAYFEEHNVNYFKGVGNATGQVSCQGGVDLRDTLLGVSWLKAYCNYVVRVNTAQLLTRMNTFRNSALYQKILDKMDSVVSMFVRLGRIEEYKNTAPTWGEAKKLGNGSTIVIPDAWQGYYVDDARRAKISGTLYVQK